MDARRLRDLSVTETERSFAPRDLLHGGKPRRLRLPLYSGDRLVAHLDMGAAEPIDDEAKREVRALLVPLTASLHASRNWRVAVTDELSARLLEQQFLPRVRQLMRQVEVLNVDETPVRAAGGLAYVHAGSTEFL
mgnify:CR=1 FL=1